MHTKDLENLIAGLSQLSRVELLLAHDSVLESKPLLDVELSTFCNLDCIICPRDRIGREMGMMTGEVLSKLVEWIPDGANIMFSGLGEPLMNPQIAEYVRQLKSRDLTVGLTTNGTLLTRRVVRDLIDSGIDMIQISLYGFSERSYSAVTRRGSFRGVLANLESLSLMRSPDLRIQISVVKQTMCRDHLVRIERFALRMGFSLLIRNRHSRGGYLMVRNATPSRTVGLDFCGIFPKVTFVTWDGSVLACCHDLEGKTCLGNIGSVSFDQLKRVKRSIITSRDWFDICRHCNDEYRFILLDNPKVVD